MNRTWRFLSLAAFFCAAALGQSADPTAAPARFDVADVRVSPHVTNPYMRGGVLRGGRLDIRTASMLDLIRAAYGVDAEKIQGGPSWLDTDRFDIIAKAPVDTPPDTFKAMLQNLLTDRFQLKIRNDAKAMPVFALSLGKGKPKLKETDGSGDKGCRGVPQDTAPGAPSYARVACRNRTMEEFAQDLHNMAGAYLDKPVIDQTGLKGAWDFDLKWTGRGQLAQQGPDGISIFDAVEKQLGLKLAPDKQAVPVLVVESVNQKPTPNAPGVAESLPPPPPAEFEVATIRPSAPGSTNAMGNIQHGLVNVQNFPLKQMIQIAWDLNGDELLVGLPKSADARYDITAKAPTPPSGDVDFEDLRLMVRALVIDRFNLKAHLEDRPVDSYVLSSVKPRMSKADPTNRTGCKEGPGADGKDPRLTNPILSRLLTCLNMTMAQFAEQLPNLANGYVHVKVQDDTGLTDAYDFTLSFSAVGLLNSPAGRGPAGANANAETASDPSGAISLPEAVNKQLGLKLEMKKRPAQVLVIDHIDDKPTEN